MTTMPHRGIKKMKQAHLHEGLRTVSTVSVFAVVATVLLVISPRCPGSCVPARPGGSMALWGRPLALESLGLGFSYVAWNSQGLRFPTRSWSLRGWCEDEMHKQGLGMAGGNYRHCPAVTPDPSDPEADPAWIPKPGSHWTAETVQTLSFSQPQRKPQSQGHETQANKSSEQMSQVISPFQRDSPAPTTPQLLAQDPTADTEQSTTPALGLGPVMPASPETEGQLGLPTRPPAKKIPEGEPFEPKLMAETSGPGLRKHWKSLTAEATIGSFTGTAVGQVLLGLSPPRGRLRVPCTRQHVGSAAHTPLSLVASPALEKEGM